MDAVKKKRMKAMMKENAKKKKMKARKKKGKKERERWRREWKKQRTQHTHTLCQTMPEFMFLASSWMKLRAFSDISFP